MNKDYEGYIRARIAAAVVKTDPFQHMLIRDVLPPELYAELDAAQPSEDEWRAGAQRQYMRTRQRGRLRFWLTTPRRPQTVHFHVWDQPDQTDFGDYSVPFHQKAGHYISAIETAVHAKLRRQDWTPGQRVFFYRESGWAIDPHTHPAAELTNNILYFPSPENSSEQGTLFYRHKNGRPPQADDTAEFRPQDLEVAAFIPYTPNTLISWINAPDSIHGSVEIAGAAARRYLYFVSLAASG
jgi:hypothetical protein